MIVTGSIHEVRDFLAQTRAAGRSVGFVPTMGALHAGHISLIERARAENDAVVVSIFVNPTQFGPQEDLAQYPRPLQDDLAVCEAHKVDLVFHPPAEEMYPEPSLTTVDVQALTTPMEGRHRPGHFQGVALVCAKLLNIVGPCRAYFGEKDAQQLRVVKRMVQDLAIPARIIPCPTVRDSDGLALSSRNAYLSAEDRHTALCLPRALKAVNQLVAEGEKDVAALREAARGIIEGSGAEVDYVEIVDPETLEPLATVEGVALACAAVRTGGVRLIDNVRVVASAECGSTAEIQQAI